MADTSQWGLLKVASAVAGLFRPLFALQASFQASSYDKEAVRREIDGEIRSAPVVLYTWELSPFSKQATALLDSMGADYKEVSLGAGWFASPPASAAKRAELGSLFGRTSLPHIFIGGRSVGGLLEGTPGLIPLYEKGELKASLKQAGALPDDGLFGFFLYSGEHMKSDS